MKLAFPNGEHENVTIGKGSISIGSSDEDDVQLMDSGVARHAIVIVDQRGITLSVEQGTAGIAVNRRLVTEKAILRLGDIISHGNVDMVLQGDIDESRPSPEPSIAVLEDPNEDGIPAKFHLRGINGRYGGSLTPIHGLLTFGSKASCDVVVNGVAAQHATIEYSPAGVRLRYLAQGSGIVVNGNLLNDGFLHAGDQIDIGGERFVIEAPGFVPGRAYGGLGNTARGSNTQVFAAPVARSADPSDGSPNELDRAASRRDFVIIAICIALSAAMLVWLFVAPQ